MKVFNFKRLNNQAGLSREQRRNYLFNVMPISRLLLVFAIPNMMLMMLQSIYIICDLTIAIHFGTGQQLFLPNFSADAQDIRLASQYAQPAINLESAVIATLMGTRIAYAAYRARTGPGTTETCYQQFASSLMNGFLFAGFFLIVVIPANYGFIILQAHGVVDQNIMLLSFIYGSLMILTFPFYFLNQMFSNALRMDGFPIRAIYGGLVSLVSNISLDLLFVIGFHWGLPGTGLATLIAATLAPTVSFILLSLVKTNSFIPALKKKYLHLDWHNFRASWILGIPAGIRYAGLFFLNIINVLFLTQLATKLATPPQHDAAFWVGVYSAAYQIFALLINGAFAFSQSINTLSAGTYVQRQKLRLADLLKWGNIYMTCYFIVATIVVASSGLWLFSLFIGAEENPQEKIRIAYFIELILCASMFLAGPQFAAASYYQSVNQNLYASMAASLRYFLIFVPVATIFFVLLKHFVPAHHEYGIYLYFLSLTVTDVISSIIILPKVIKDYYQLRKTGLYEAMLTGSPYSIQKSDYII